MSTCEQENEDEEGVDRIVDKNVRTRDDEPAFGTSRHYDHAISKSSMIDSSKTISTYEELIHEHDFVQITPKNRKSFVRCLTCCANFCEVCGKVLDDGHILRDRRKCLALIQRIFL